VVPTSAQATSVYDCSSLLSVEIRRCENALFFFSVVLDVPGPLNINFVSICLFFENFFFFFFFGSFFRSWGRTQGLALPRQALYH